MKKTFNLVVSNKKPERQADSIKHEIKKYLTRESKKKLPATADFWEFKCKFGNTQEEAQSVHVGDINSKITNCLETGVETFYIEILSKAGVKPNRVKKRESK